MRVCAISFKGCWQDDEGRWISDGGFPLQMKAISSLFEAMTLLVTRVPPRRGGLPLPPAARVVPLRHPQGQDWRRKLSVLGHMTHYLATIAREVRDVDVVHVPLPGDLSLIGMLVALALRKRLLVRYGGSWSPTCQTTMMNRVTRELMRRFAGGRNVMLAAGEGDYPPAQEVHWLFSTAMTAEELAGIDRDLDRGLSAPPRLIYAGRLSPEKGVPYLIEAIAALKERGNASLPELVLAGDGPERGPLEGLVRERGVESHVRFLGQLDRIALSRQFHWADVCVQPSLTEGFSKAWIDAMAHGLPVLTCEVGAARAVIGRDGERGWLVPPGDVPALVRAIETIISSPYDWKSIRCCCRCYAQVRTLEAWAQRIGETCERQWGLAFKEGKLRLR
jgi:glycosyltransferase involved in cell wall biosynthesis